MKLENIGFYTLSNKRARRANWESDLYRCELVLTDKCNFKCPYCRGIKKELQGDIPIEKAKEIIDIWGSGNIKNVRFSGGEPTLYKELCNLICYCSKYKSIKHIALSTNGSAELSYYKILNKLGVNDFSISFDACCSSTANKMAGTNSNFDHICHIIRNLSKIAYVTVGVVLNNENEKELNEIIKFATSLNVSDIRVIPSAQTNQKLNINLKTKYKILKYRLNNIKSGRHVRGLTNKDCKKCHLVKDDIAILNDYHYPCIIYMREQGNYIGNVYGKSLKEIRMERKKWFENTDTHLNKICKNNCLDVCIDYNNMVEYYSNENCSQYYDNYKGEIFI